MKIIIEAPPGHGGLWKLHTKLSSFLGKKHLHSLRVYWPSSVKNVMTLDVLQPEHAELVLTELRWLLAPRPTWKLTVLPG